MTTLTPKCKSKHAKELITPPVNMEENWLETTAQGPLLVWQQGNHFRVLCAVLSLLVSGSTLSIEILLIENKVSHIHPLHIAQFYQRLLTPVNCWRRHFELLKVLNPHEIFFFSVNIYCGYTLQWKLTCSIGSWLRSWTQLKLDKKTSGAQVQLTIWTVPKYRSTNVYTSSYIRHRTVQCEVTQSVSESALPSRCFSRAVGPTSRVAHSFGSDKLYICLSNKCFNCIQCICCVTDVRPSQDHRILRVQMVRINLANLCRLCKFFWDGRRDGQLII